MDNPKEDNAYRIIIIPTYAEGFGHRDRIPKNCEIRHR